MKVALAATIHDSAGRLAPAIAQAAPVLHDLFAGIALNISDATPPSVLAAAREHLSAKTMVHAQGEAIIGRARRDAVRLALDGAADAILYCDFDHLLRWAAADAAELRAMLAAQPTADLLVVGRSPAAFAAQPERLRLTEQIVNRLYARRTGHAWDLMFAIRRLSRRVAELIVRDGRVDTVANDVEWSLLARRAGLRLGYVEADALHYRAMEEFGAPADTLDSDPREWKRRLDYAALHVEVLATF